MSKQAFTMNRLLPLPLKLSLSHLLFPILLRSHWNEIKESIITYNSRMNFSRITAHQISFLIPVNYSYYGPSCFYHYDYSTTSFSLSFAIVLYTKLLSKKEQWDLLSWKVNSILLFSFLDVLSRSFLVSWSFNRYIILLPGITGILNRVRVFHESLCTSFELVLIVFIQCQLLFLLPVIDFVIVDLTDNWFESV